MCFKLQLVIWFSNLLVLQKNMKVPVILEVWVICKSLQENLGKVLLFNSFVIQYTMIKNLMLGNCFFESGQIFSLQFLQNVLS